MSKGQKQLNLAEELKDVLAEYSEELFKDKEEALNAAADYFVGELEEASPYDPTSEGKHLRDSWKRTDKYTGVRYIGNTKVVGKNKFGYAIPLANLVEFSEKGKPFIRKTFEENKEKIIQIIKEGLQNGNTK